MQVDFTDFGDPRVSWLVKYNPLLWRFRRMKMLFCSLPGCPGDRSIVIAPGADSARVLALLDEQMVRIANELRLDAVVYKEFRPDHIGWMDPLLAHGYARVEIPPMHSARSRVLELRRLLRRVAHRAIASRSPSRPAS
jgi:hypothetical protein